MTKYIKAEDLKSGHLYKILARNANYGIWIPEVNGFIISRTKFYDTFLFVEYHWDGGCEGDEAFGTAKPLEDLGRTPFDYTPLIQIAKSVHADIEISVLKFLSEKKDVSTDPMQ
jgi:hypothetical protein